MVAHAFRPRTWEAKAGGISMSSRPTWSTKQVSGQLRLLYREILSRKKKSEVPGMFLVDKVASTVVFLNKVLG